MPRELFSELRFQGYWYLCNRAAALLPLPPSRESVLKKQGIRPVVTGSMPLFWVKLTASEVFISWRGRWEHYLQLHPLEYGEEF